MPRQDPCQGPGKALAEDTYGAAAKPTSAKDMSAKPTTEKATVLFKPGTGKNGKSNRAERRAQEAQRKARNVR